MRITSKNLSITIYYCIYVYRKSVNMKTEEQNTLELDTEVFTTRISLGLILDIMYNNGDLNFWWDKIVRISYDQRTLQYGIVLYNADRNKYKTIHLSTDKLSEYIMKYEI
jgi:hypothetical protein